MKPILRSILLLCFLGVMSGVGRAQVRTDDYYLANPDPRRCSFYGINTACTGPWLMAGTYTCNGTGQAGRGQMTVFRRSEQGYSNHQILSLSPGANFYSLGETGIDLAGDILIASCPSWPDEYNPEGLALVYELSNGSWDLRASLQQPNFSQPEGFGRDVAVNSDTVFVSAISAGPVIGSYHTYRGTIYMYQKTAGAWTLSQEWSPPANSTFDRAFAGQDMAAGDQALAWGNHQANTLYIMEPDGNGVWDLSQVMPSFSPRNDSYGWAIDVDDDTIAVGVEDASISAYGMVHIVRRVAGMWVPEATLQAPDPAGHGDSFGFSVDLKGDVLAVGAPAAGDLGGSGRSPGAVYIFERDSLNAWNFKYKLIRPDGVMWDELGTSVSIGDDYILVGDRAGRVPPAFVYGSAFVYELPLGYESCAGTVNSTGVAAGLEVVGTGVADTNWVTLRALDVPASSVGMFLGSQTPLQPISLPNSQGDLCLGGSIYRFNDLSQLGFASASGVHEMRLETPAPIAGAAPILAGESWSFQFWYRDRNPGSTTNFSSSRRVQFR
ncbi:MAG: FG-GAP repeat protein [Planctomycetes bacterium]|nr:FG-GAP repeat protein [Planctomycetota bacterium]